MERSFLLITLTFVMIVSAQNECSKNVYKELGDLTKRSPTFLMDAVPICDRYLVKDWYVAVNHKMPTTAPELGSCGTLYPIWLDDTLPELQGTTKSVSLCQVGFGNQCSQSHSIRVTNCGTFFVYELTPLDICQSAYCFEKTETCVNGVPSNLAVAYHGVSWNTKHYGLQTVHDPDVNLVCQFDRLPDQSLFYDVTWYVDDTEVLTNQTVSSKSSDLALLTGSQMLAKGKKANSMVQCIVGAKLSATGVRCNTSSSPLFFAGIKVLTPTLTIARGGHGQVKIQFTIPFVNRQLVYLNAEYQDELKISIGVHGGSVACDDLNKNFCEKKVYAYKKRESDKYNTDDWKVIHNIAVYNKDDVKYNLIDKHITLRLETGGTSGSGSKIFDRIILPDIQVFIEDTDPSWKGAYCASHTDPHMKTFDGKYYECQLDGTFILYRNSHFNQEVQEKHHLCYPAYSYPRCSCAVAVRSGKDVFMVDICNSKSIIHFPSCGDKVLKVIKTNDRYYKIILPTGTLVEIKFVSWPTHNDWHLNVDIFPSPSDVGNSSGLCGVLDGNYRNDFTRNDATGTVDSPHLTYPNDFSESWRVKGNEVDLFDSTSYNNLESISEVLDRVCTCKRHSPTARTGDIECNYGTYQNCKFVVGKQYHCILNPEGQLRRKRDLRHLELMFSNAQTKNKPERRHKREVVPNIKSYEEAETICNTAFQGSTSYQICQEYVTDLSNMSLINCISDVMMTGDDNFTQIHIEAALEQCSVFVVLNTTFQETEPEITYTIETFCQNNCSGHGICNAGNCTCNEGYAGSDCSFDLLGPPTITHMSDFGLCDKSHETCDEITLYGKYFIENMNTSCFMTRHTSMEDGSSVSIDDYVVGLEERTLFEGFCPLEYDSSNHWVTEFSFNISNDGSRFTENFQVYTYQSLCQEYQNDTGNITFVFKEGYCFINNSCVADGSTNTNNKCDICNTAKSKSEWSYNEGHCYISGVCYKYGVFDGSNACSICDPSVDKSAWSPNTDLCFIDVICYGDGQTQIDEDCHVCHPNVSRSNWTLKNDCVSTINSETTTTSPPTTTTILDTTVTTTKTIDTTTQEPTTTTREPTTTTQTPITTTPEPTTTTPEPTTMTQEPTTTTQTHTTSTSEPTTSTPKHTTLTPEPTTSTPELTRTTPGPTTTTQEPPTTTQEPTTTTPEPTITTEEPTTTTQKPTTTTQEPTTTIQNPTTSPQEPPTTMQKLTTTTQKPTTYPQEPPTTTEEPTTTTQEPPTTTPEPTTTTQEPINTTQEPPQEPPTTTQKPTTTTQNPPISPQEPPATTQEPTTTTQEPTTTTQEPTIKTQKPTATTLEPTTATQEVPTTTQEPTTTTHEPTTTTQELTTSTPEPTTTTQKPTITTQKPTAAASEPTTTTQELPTTTQEPTTTTHEPSTTTQESSTTTQEPTTTTQEPTIISHEPVTTPQELTTTTPEPTTTTQELRSKTQEPTTATQEPSTTTQELTISTPEPTTTTQEPTTTTQEPTTTTQEPTITTQKPTATTSEPTTATQELPTTTQEPTTTTHEPSTTTQEPTTTTQEPTIISHEPVTTSQELTTTTPEPTTTTQEPTTKTQEPTTATQELTTTTQEPTTTSVPTTTTQELKTKTQEPTTTTQEPTTTSVPTTTTEEPTTASSETSTSPEHTTTTQETSTTTPELITITSVPLTTEQPYCMKSPEEVSVEYHSVSWFSTNETNTTTIRTVHQPYINFKCMFVLRQDTSVFYKIEWFVNNATLIKTVTVSEADIGLATLSSNDLPPLEKTAGLQIQCTVSVSKDLAPANCERNTSPVFFAGIKVNQAYHDLLRKGKTSIMLYMTIPYVTKTVVVNGQAQPLSALAIYSLLPQSTSSCRGTIGVDKCVIEFKAFSFNERQMYDSNDWRQNQTLVLNHVDTNGYEIDQSMTVQLKARSDGNTFWNNFNQNISMTIRDYNEYWKGTSCGSKTDPHMYTFDGVSYENHIEGEFVLYRNMLYNQEVQTRHKQCHPDYNFPHCTCAVSVQSGQDVFLVDLCGDVQFVDFLSCNDSVIQVYKKSDKLYKISLPTGTYVMVSLVEWPVQGSWQIDIDIYPSLSDVYNTVGLCGTLDGDRDNDFKKRNGDTDNVNLVYPDDFSNSWKVLDNENLLKEPLSTRHPISSTLDKICMCTSNGDQCSYNTLTHCSTTVEKQFRCTELTVETSVSRKKRALSRKWIPPSLSVPKPLTRNKRDVQFNISTSRENAESVCTLAFESSDPYKTCQEYVSDLSNSSLSNCINDVIMTGDYNITAIHVEAALQQCVTFVGLNTTLQNANPVVTTSLQSLCPSNCSAHGVCNKGNCSCEVGFGGSDCSFDILSPPVIWESTPSAICDKSLHQCSRVYLKGRYFLENVEKNCFFNKQSIHHDGSVLALTQLESSLEDENLFRGSCSIPSNDVTSWVTKYMFNVSYNRKHFTQSFSFYTYQSECQQHSVEKGLDQFTLKKEYCFINNTCVQLAAINPENRCQVCYPDRNNYQWSGIQDCESTTTPEPSALSTSTIVYTVTASVLGFIFVVAIVVVIGVWKYRRSRQYAESSEDENTDYRRDVVSKSWMRFFDDGKFPYIPRGSRYSTQTYSSPKTERFY